MPIKKISIFDDSTFGFRYLGLGNKIKTDGITTMLKINAIKIPKESKIPISRARGNEWESRHRKLTTVVKPANRIGIPTLRIVFLRVCPLVDEVSEREYSK